MSDPNTHEEPMPDKDREQVPDPDTESGDEDNTEWGAEGQGANAPWETDRSDETDSDSPDR